MKNIAIIPARSGSKGLPDKNIRLLGGKPLLAYTIEAAIQSGCFDTVHVSTDSEHYAEIARQYGADVPFLRSAALATDTASTWDAVREALCRYAELGKTFDTMMLMQPTTPLRTGEDVKGAYALLKEKQADLVVLAGFMTILGKRVIQAFENRIINIHPALIPSFCGEGYYGLRVHKEALKKGVKVTGATAHFVNEICDGGPIIIQRAVEIKSGDTPEILQRRVMEQAEWHILPQAVNLFCNDKIKVIGNTTEILE